MLTSLVSANPITDENLNPGSRGWVLSADGSGHNADDVTGQIKGYTSVTSVNKGGQIDFKVSVNPAQSFSIEIYRVGWYGGDGGRLMTAIGPLAGSTQPPCPKDEGTRMIECNWPASYSLTIPSDWTSGIYLVKFKNADGYDSGTLFAVRDDSRTADFLYQLPVTTYQAYNLYPDGLGGNSLYGNSSGEEQAVKVSFNRPYADYKSSTNGYADFTYYDLPLIKWLEKMGYDVAYSTDMDTHTDGSRLLNYKTFISSGHDEYWSKEMRDAVETARSNRVNLAVFGSNVAYWQIRFEPAGDGAPNRTMVAYKENAADDPIADPALKTDLFRSASVNRPEQTLLGVQFITYSNLYSSTAFSDLVVKNTSHWAYRNSGLTEGQAVSGLVGYEIDTIFPGAENQAPASDFTILAESPYTNVHGNPYTQHSVLYRTMQNSWVFSSGTMVWSWALDNDIFESSFFGDRRSSAIQVVTKNLLDHFNDRNLPNISISQPGDSRAVSGNAVDISAEATDDLGIARVKFQLDGANVGAVDSTSPYSITWDSTSTSNGNHILTAIAEDEAGNANTSAPVTITVNNAVQPDVVVTSLTYADGKFTSIVKNQGNAATPANVNIGVGYYVDGVYRTWGAVRGPLAAGASVTIGTNGSSYSMPSGQHSITAYVDDVNRFAEADETNNRLTTAINNLILPDVVVTSVSYSDGVFTSVIKNQGPSATPIGVNIGVGYAVDGRYRTWGAVRGPLAAGASVTIGANGGSFVIPPGTHSYTATVDDVNRFAESNESNNQLTESITLP